MACMSCGELNKNYKYILYTAIFAFFTNFIFGYTFNDNMEILLFYKSREHINLSYHIILHYIFRFIGILILSLIFYKIEQKSAQKQTPTIKNEEESLDELESSSSSIKLIYKDVKEDLNLKINISPLNIFIVLSIMVLQGILEDIFYKSTLRALDFWMFELPLLSYLSSKEFKFKIYRHHKLAIFTNIFICAPYKIILLIILIFISTDIFNKTNDYNFNVYKYYKGNLGLIPIGIIFYLIIMVSRSYAITKIKVFMDLKYISPNKILMIYGIIGILISIIVGTISTFIDCQTIGEVNLKICKINDGNKSYFENFYLYFKTLNSDTELLLFELIFFVGIITNFFYMFYYILIIKKLTPIHSIFSNLTYSFLLQLVGYFYENLNKPQNQNQYNNDEDNKDTKGKTDYSFLNLIFLGFITQIIVFFGLLVYLEIIELNFCKLNENLRRYIIDRSIKDYELNKIDKITDNDKEDDEDAINNSNSQNL